MSLGRLVTRTVIGGLFIGHGTQKLFGWFGGPGPDGTREMMEALDMRPAPRNAFAAGWSETAGGALLVTGLATPLAAAGLIGTMITAIRKVHLSNGPWVANGGYEYNLVLVAALVGLVDGGPGALSVDRLLGVDDTDARWALTALALGAVASTAAVELGRRTSTAGVGTDVTDPVDGGPFDEIVAEATVGDPVTSESATGH